MAAGREPHACERANQYVETPRLRDRNVPTGRAENKFAERGGGQQRACCVSANLRGNTHARLEGVRRLDTLCWWSVLTRLLSPSLSLHLPL